VPSTEKCPLCDGMSAVFVLAVITVAAWRKA
jgi:hypothetical protein